MEAVARESERTLVRASAPPCRKSEMAWAGLWVDVWPADRHKIVIKSSAELLYVCLWTASIMSLRAVLLALDTRGILGTCSCVDVGAPTTDLQLS